eukprot:TRINITY_DN7322_c0_g1_i1.p1 TRINITY_DN7322_c0_g1~~TRINITY_DN7322_c0_g1_i1.p1  ORF type:complete len:371 (+),score=84.17 TRINITY_DN7322_c0_g1_i1:369-1481(+)
MGISESKLEKKLSEEQFEWNDEHLFGLHNFGNTCYCNSVLQALYFCLPLRKYVLNYFKNVNTICSSENAQEVMIAKKLGLEGSLLFSLGELYYDIYTQRKRTGTLAPKDFVQELKRENVLFRSLMHQDAHEFLNFLLNTMAELLQNQKKQQKDFDIELIKDFPNTKGKTFIHNIFEGILVNETRCLCCENVSSRDETFLDLSIDIEPNSSVSHCLRNFSKIETLSGTDKFYCDHCCSLQEAQKRMRIKKLPSTLIIHLKRFKYIEQIQSHKKLLHRVPFPFELTLSSTADGIEEDDDTYYELFSVVIHVGIGPNQGHYVSLIKINEQWLLYDDEKIEVINPFEIQTYFGVFRERLTTNTTCGYLLFYQSV